LAPTRTDRSAIRRRAECPAAQRVDQLDLVHLQIATDHDEHELVRLRGPFAHEKHGLERLRCRHAEKIRYVLDRLAVRRRHLLHGHHFDRLRLRERELRRLDVGRVAARLAPCERILALLVPDHEFVACPSTHRARIGLDRDGLDADAFEDAPVRRVHPLVEAVQVVGVGVQRVGVLHGELAQPDQPTPRARLVAVLGLNLEEVLRKLLVAVDLARGQRRDDLLVGGTEHERTPARALELLEHRSERVPAPGGLPQFGGMHDRQPDLLPADGFHLLAHDPLNLAQHAPAKRH
jgi:hypothetical protein